MEPAGDDDDAAAAAAARRATLAKVRGLTDLELAVLLCLVGREHGLVSTPPRALDALVAELRLVCCAPRPPLPLSASEAVRRRPPPSAADAPARAQVAADTFGLECVVVDCNAATTLELFAAALLASRPDAPPRLANCVLAKNLDRAPRSVQMQALELLRTRRIFPRTAVQVAPRHFVLVPVLAARAPGDARLAPHLNDFFCLAHWHDPRNGFANLDDGGHPADAAPDAVARSLGPLPDGPALVPAAAPYISEAVRDPFWPLVLPSPRLTSPRQEISQLAQSSHQVRVDVDVLRYQMNIVSFLRMHRAVAHGATPAATKHFDTLMRCLAPIHDLDYITPALVALAARKVYLHRICISAPDKERSMQWGSRLEAVEALLEHVRPEQVIEDVLDTVTAPL